MNMVTCDNCNQDFKMDIKEEEVKDNIFKVYFTCPHCSKEYISYYTNVLIKIKQKKIRDIVEKQKESRGKQDINRSNKLYKQYQKLKKEIKKDMDNLKKRIEGN